MGRYKRNKVKCDFGSYIHYWRGVKKSGKTTLFYDTVKEQYGSLDKGLLISIGNEIGFQALDDIIYAEAPDWAEFIDIVDDLVENKSDNEFEIVALDTVDELVAIAKEEVKRLHKKAKGVAVEFNACFGGYGAPRDKVVELIDEQMARIKRAGYGLVCIGHTKIRDIKEKNGDNYQQLTSNLNADFDGIFSNKADFVMTIAVEKSIDENKHIDGTERYMYFRSDGFVDAGGRFSEMPEKVPYGAKNYIDAFMIGVRNAINGNVSDTEIQKRANKEKSDRDKKALEYAQESVDSKVDVETNENLKIIIQTAFSKMDKEQKDAFKEKMAEHNVTNFKDVSDIPTKDLQALVDCL